MSLRLILLFSLLLILSKAFSQAPNDDCFNATLIVPNDYGSYCTNSNNLAATADGYADACDAGATPPLAPGGNEVWFTFITQGDSNYIHVSTGSVAPTIVDPSISVMTGGCANMSTLICNSGLFSAEVSFNVPAGTQVWFSVTALTTDGNFDLCIVSSNTTLPSGADCASAARLCNTLSVYSSDLNPAGSVLVPSCFPGPPVHPSWFKFTVGTTGLMEFSGHFGALSITNGAHWALYEVTDTADVCNNPALLSCNSTYVPFSVPGQDFGMSQTVTGCTGSSYCPSVQVDSGKTYLLLIDNVNGDAGGFALWWDGSSFEMLPTADFVVSKNNACANELIDVHYEGNGTVNAAYNWNPAQSSNDYTISFAATGKNYISLTVSENGCTDTHLEEINVFPVPVADAGSDVSFCISDTIGALPVAGYTYQWIPATNLNLPSASQTAVYGNNLLPYDSTINYILVATLGICSDSDTVVVNVIPRQSAAIVPPPDQCAGTNIYSFNMVNDSVPNAVFSWTFQNATPATSQAFEPSGVHFNSSGQFAVSVVAQSPGCPADSVTEMVTVFPAPVVSFQSDVSTGCPPLEVELYNTSPALAGGMLTWNPGTGVTDTVSGDTASVIFNYSGIYYPTLTITSPDGCSTTDTLNIPIDVLTLPDASFSTDPPFPEDLYPFVEFTNSEFNGLCFYSFGDGDSSYDCQTSHLFPGEGSYPVQLIVTGTNGCIDTTLRIIEIKKFYTLYIPKAFTPNNDGRNDRFIILGDGVEELDVQIYNRRGERVFRTGDLNRFWDGTRLDTGNPVPDGVYVYEIKSRDVNRKKHYYKGQVTVVR